MKETTGVFVDACVKCRKTFDLASAEWCLCLTKQRSFVCPRCGGCACSVRASARNEFWVSAPKLLWERRREMVEESIRRLQALSPDSVQRPFALVVDDEPRILAVAQRVLSGMGFTTMTCEDPEEALRIARAVLPDLVLTDALMPKLDGRELCRLLKTGPATSRIRVIVMTATFKGIRYANEAHKEFLVDGYLEKPVSTAALTETVQRIVGGQARVRVSA